MLAGMGPEGDVDAAARQLRAALREADERGVALGILRRQTNGSAAA
jgi:hypothetical protein